MAVIVILISISLVIAVGFLMAFLWNLRDGQYDDTYSPSVRMLFDDRAPGKTRKELIKGDDDHDSNHRNPVI